MHKEIFKNTSYQFLSKIITTGIGFLITILIANHFGVSTFGDLSKITSYVALFYLFVDFGLNAVFLKNSRSYSSFFYLRILLGLVVFVIANAIAIFLPYNPILQTGFSSGVKIGIFIFSFTLFAQSIIYSSSAVFQKNLRYDLFMISQVIGAIFNLFLIAVLVFFEKSIIFVIFSYVISTFLTSFITIFFVRENLKKFDMPYSREIFYQSVPIGLMLIFNLIYFRIDIILLSVFKPSVDVGIYALAYKFFDFFIAIPLFLSNSLYPKMIDSLKSSIKFKNLTKNYFFIYFLISIVIIIPAWFLSPLFALINPGFALAIVPFRILILSLPVFFLTCLVQWILISLNQQKFLMYAYFFCALLNIGLNYILIPKYSYVGSAVITGVSELVIFIIILTKLRRDKFFKQYE
jgi:O-antigen/teichoic acid export membrane protein